MLTENKNPEMNYEFTEEIEQEIKNFSQVYNYGEKSFLKNRQKDGTWTSKQRRYQWITSAVCISISILSLIVFTTSDSSHLFNGFICVLTFGMSIYLIRRGFQYLKALRQIEEQNYNKALEFEPEALWSLQLPHHEYEPTKYKLLMLIFQIRSLYKMVSDADSEDFGFEIIDKRLGFLATRVISMQSMKDHSSLAVVGEIFINRRNSKQLFRMFLPTIEMNFMLLEETLKND